MVSIKSALEFDEMIRKDNVFVHFYADWSGPCKMLDMILEEMEGEYPDVSFIKVDCDRFRSICKEYKVLNVPVCMVFDKGKVVRSQNGFMRKEELVEFIHQS